MPRYLFISVFVFLLCLFVSISVYAQDDVCPEIVNHALESVNNSCSNVNRNSACYGYNQVNATFNIDVPEDFFTQVADIAPLLDLETLQTAGLNAEEDTWGVAVMNIQANLPDTLPGQSVTILLMGNTEIHNEVDADSAFIPGEAITVTTVAPASNIRNAPSTTAPVPGSVPSGTEFLADGQSPDGEWIRIIYEGRPGWLNKILVDFDEALNDLPVIESGQFTPMQAFSFRTGIGQPVCSRAPDSLVIQGPNNIDVTINANGVDINIGSTIVLRTPEDNTMQVLAVSGSANVDGLVVPGGFTVSTELSDEGDVIPGTVTGFRAISDAELAELSVLEDMNPEMMQYPVVLPTRGEILRLQNAIQNREDALNECNNRGFTAHQCLNIIGSDGNLANRMQRCLDLGLAAESCRSIIGGQLNAQTVLRCLNEGFTSEEACREAHAEDGESTLQSFCESGGATTETQCVTFCQSQGYSNLEECQTAAVSLSQASGGIDNLMAICQQFGATTVDECRSLCESRGYTSIQECVTAANESSGGGGQTSSTSTQTQQQSMIAFCQSIGASTQQQCAQICSSNGYTTLSSCRAGMG